MPCALSRGDLEFNAEVNSGPGSATNRLSLIAAYANGPGSSVSIGNDLNIFIDIRKVDADFNAIVDTGTALNDFVLELGTDDLGGTTTVNGITIILIDASGLSVSLNP